MAQRESRDMTKRESKRDSKEMSKRDSQKVEPLEINVHTCTSLTYDFDKKKYGKFDIRKPSLSQLLEWKCLQAKLGFYSKAKTFLGIRVAVSSWTEAYVAVTDDKLYFYKSVDELDKVTDFTLDLEECVVHDLGESEGRPHTFSVTERKGVKIVLAAENRYEYLTFTRAIRLGCSPFMLEALPVFHQKAAIVARSFRRNYHRQRYLTMKRGFTRLQAVVRGRRARRQFEKDLQAVVKIQSFLRMGLAKHERELLKLQGNVQKYQMIRTYTFQEIVSTEESYVKDLDTLLNVFLKPIKAVMEAAEKSHHHDKNAANDPNPARADIVVTTLNHIQDIRNLHGEFLTKLKAKSEQWSEKTEIGGLFIELADKLDIYFPYGLNYEKSKKNFEAAKKNERLRQLLDEMAQGIKQVKKLDIFGFLILPIQRVPRYSLLLSDLLKRTWKDHPDYHPIAEAVLKMQKAGAVLNETRKKEEERRKTQTIIGKFKEPTAIQDLLDRSSNSACLKEGPVVSNHTTATEDDPRKYIKAQLFLFSDQMVLAKKNVDKKMNGKTFKIWNTIKFSDAFSIPLTTITSDATPLTGTEAHQFGISIQMQGLKLKIFPPSAEARDAWIADINQARFHAKKLTASSTGKKDKHK